MYILHKLGVEGRIWNIINDCHGFLNTQSAVVVSQCQSKYFTVSEGIRQVGVLSGLLYLVFINDLLVELEQCNCRTGIFHINACASSLADDVSCISTSPKTLQCMLDVCNEYSRKWCFRFNAKKSYILQFSLNPREKNLIYNWHIGDDKIPSSDNCCHLGIEGSLSKYTHFFLFIFW
jgi:hypothetical protein